MRLTKYSGSEAVAVTEKDDLETPVLVSDMDQMEQNLSRYAQFAEREGVTLRSHAKAHKIPEIARWQSEVTGGGILCQTLGEAEVMAENGLDDIYLSYMVVTEDKLHRLVSLAESIRYFATTVDSEANVSPLQRVAATRGTVIDVILEIDLGLNRVGVNPGSPAVSLAELIREQSHLRLAGVMGYEGHIGYGTDGARTRDEYDHRCRAAMDTIAETVTRIEAAGVPVEEVMAGSTATARYSGQHPAVTEVHPGMYLFNDANLVECTPDVTKDDCAATIITTVISKPSPDRAIVDGGSKTFSLDLDQMPVPKHRDDLTYYNASEEHGWIDTSRSEQNVSVGDRIEFIVPHVCTSVNLHDRLVGVRDGRVETVWAVAARGKLQ